MQIELLKFTRAPDIEIAVANMENDETGKSQPCVYSNCCGWLNSQNMSSCHAQHD